MAEGLDLRGFEPPDTKEGATFQRRLEDGWSKTLDLCKKAKSQGIPVDIPPKFSFLDIKGRIRPADFQKLLAAFKTDRAFAKINKLKLNVYHLGDLGLIEMCQLLLANKTLTDMRFKVPKLMPSSDINEIMVDNDPALITMKGVKALCDVIKSNTTLRTLSVRGNALKTELVKPILEALHLNHTLHYMDFAENHLGAATPELVDLIKRDGALARINLLNTDLTAELMETVLLALQQNYSIRQVTLSENPLARDSRTLPQAFLDLLQRNRTIQLMKIDPNFVDKQIDAFKSLLERNNHYRLELSTTKGFVHTCLKESNGNFLLLQRCHLRAVPKTISKYDTLKELVLSYNEFTALPPELCNLRQLMYLTLKCCALTTVDPAISGLVALTSLSLAENKLTTLPDAFGTLPVLQRLYLQQNDFQIFPLVVTSLSTLTMLDLSQNKLKVFPKEACSLPAIQTLYLQRNQLTTIHPDVTSLKSLERMYLCDNSLEYLPVSMHRLEERLQLLDVDRNPFTTVPKDVVAQPQQPKAIFKFLRDLEQESKVFSTVKLMIVGEGNVGKTTLRETLSGVAKTKKKGPNVATDGIDGFSEKIVFTPEGSSVPITCLPWDFAGQQVYYSTHAFFLTKRAIYLIVFNLVDPKQGQAAIEYWLQCINARAAKAPVIVIGTHVDDKHCTKEYVDGVWKGLCDRYNKRNFPDIVDWLAISSKSGRGLPELKACIAQICNERKYVPIEVPPTYVQLSERLRILGDHLPSRERKPPIVSWKEFSDLAADFNLPHMPADATPQQRKQKLQEIAAFLSDVSTLLYFPEDESMSDQVFLSSAWLTQVMATLFTLKHNYIREGKLFHGDLAQLWREPLYPEQIHASLIKTLKNFDVLFPLEMITRHGASEPEEVSLVPSVLPDTRPMVAKDRWKPLAPPTVTMEWMRVYVFKFLPYGFFPRLIVRTLHLQQFKAVAYWRTGMLIEDQHGLLSLLEYNPSLYRLKIQIRLNGNEYNSDHISLLWENVDSLISGWYAEMLKTKDVACVHCLKERSYDPFLFSMDDLELTVATGKQYVYCRGIHPVRIDMLASEVALADIESLRIDYNLIKVDEKVLGEGSFAKVYKGVYNSETVAVKRMNFVQNEDTEDSAVVSKFQEFRREALLMSGLSHPNVCALRGICISPFCLVTEFLPHGDLYKFIHSQKEFSWNLAIKIAIDIAEGMNFLHSCTPPVIHRDLKTPNILMLSTDENARICAKVCDFGLSLRTHSAAGREVGNPVWLAPEIMKRSDKPPEYNAKSDVYSFGIMLWELYHIDQNPFDEWPNLLRFTYKLEDAIVTQNLRPTIQAACHPEYATLIKECWAPNPKDRPSFEVLLKRFDVLNGKLAPTIKRNVFSASDFEFNSKSLAESNASSARGNGSSLVPHSGTGSSSAVAGGADTQGKEKARLSTGQHSHSSQNSPEVSSKKHHKRVPGSPSSIMNETERKRHDAKRKLQANKTVRVAVGARKVAFIELPPDTKNQPPLATSVQQMLVIGTPEKREVWVVSSGPAQEIIVYEVAKRELVKKWIAHDRKILAICQVGDEVWTGGLDLVIKIWDVRTYECTKTIKSKLPVSCFAVVDDVVWAGSDVGIRVFKGIKEKKLTPLPVAITSMRYLPSKGVVWLGTPRNVVVLDKEKMTQKMILEGHTDVIHSIIKVGSEVWTASSDKTIRVWSDEGDLVQSLIGHTSRVFDIVALGIEYVWSVSWDKSIFVWHAQNHSYVTAMKQAHRDAIASVIAIDENGYVNEVWAGGWDGVISVWRLSEPIMVPSNL